MSAGALTFAFAAGYFFAKGTTRWSVPVPVQFLVAYLVGSLIGWVAK